MKPSDRIDQILNLMLPKNYDDLMVNELRPIAIMKYLDEQHAKERGGEVIDWWPFCAKEGCSYRICLKLKSIFCWPHTMHDFRRIKREKDHKENGGSK